MTRLKQLRKFFGYTQEKLASLLNVSRSAVAMWETSAQTPDYDTLRKLSQIFDVPPDFVLGVGIFEKWDDIVKYYDSVSWRIINSFPRTLEMPSFCGDKCLAAWLDTRLYFEPDELQLARWFHFAVRDIDIVPTGRNPDGRLTADVSVRFTPEFEAIVSAERAKNDKAYAPNFNTIRLASRDGSFLEERLSDDELALFQSMLDHLRPITDESI